MNKKVLTVGICGLLILVVFICGCFEDNNNNNDPYYKIKSVNVILYKSYENASYLYGDQFGFSCEYYYRNLKGKNERIKYSILFIKNESIINTGEFEEPISDSSAEGAMSTHITLKNDTTPIPDKYRVEVYWRDMLMDSKENIPEILTVII